jgi:hypothetical protein
MGSRLIGEVAFRLVDIERNGRCRRHDFGIHTEVKISARTPRNVVLIGSISVVAIFMTKDAEVLRFAFDTVKTLMGFFIGVATTLIGST